MVDDFKYSYLIQICHMISNISIHQLAGAVEYGDCISGEEKDHCLTNFQYMTLNNSKIPLFPVPLWPGVILPVRVPSIDQIEMFNHLQFLKPFNCVQMKLLMLDSNTWNYLTVCKHVNSSWFKNCYLQTICLQMIYVCNIRGAYDKFLDIFRTGI